MDIIWKEVAWKQYVYFCWNDKLTAKKINNLLESIIRNGYNCIGHPEKLKDDLSNYYSVRIDSKNRIVFIIDNNSLYIYQCGSHYGQK